MTWLAGSTNEAAKEVAHMTAIMRLHLRSHIRDTETHVQRDFASLCLGKLPDQLHCFFAPASPSLSCENDATGSGWVISVSRRACCNTTPSHFCAQHSTQSDVHCQLHAHKARLVLCEDFDSSLVVGCHLDVHTQCSPLLLSSSAWQPSHLRSVTWSGRCILSNRRVLNK